jgi:nicotinamide-nucleotide amidase
MLAAEIILIGDRLLTPFLADTSSLWVTERLNAIGVDVKRKTITGNDQSLWSDLLADSLNRTPLVIILDSSSRQESHLIDKFCQQLFIQPQITILTDQTSRASGRYFSKNNQHILWLPNELSKLQPLFEQALPALSRLFPPFYLRRRILKVIGLSESAVDSQIAPIYTQYSNLTTMLLFYQAEVHIRLAATANSETAAEQLLDDVSAKFSAKLGRNLFAWHGETLEQVVAAALIAKQHTIAVIDNCSSGQLINRLTSPAGSEKFFLHGEVVAYQRQMELKLLNHEGEIISISDCVSPAGAEAMAVSIRRQVGATIGLSITGIVDAEQSDSQHPVGLAYLAIADSLGVSHKRLQLLPDRERLHGMAAIFSLDILRRKI